MGVDAKHPLYTEMLPDWELMRHTYRGERTIKEQGFRYLDPTPGMIQDGIENTNQAGFKAYKAYRNRAYVPDLVREAVEAAIGVMHQKPPVIELPAAMEPMREMATLRHESLEVLLRRINESQLICGRLGLLVDFPTNTRIDDPELEGSIEVTTPALQNRDFITPYIAMYECEKLINWDQGYRDGLGIDTLNFIALDESEAERTDNFEWKDEKKYRILILGDAETNVQTAQYKFAVFRDNDTEFDETRLQVPMFRGNILDEIPFTVINSKDVVADPDDAPLIGLARLVLSIYRQDADYKQSLYLQGQDTLVIIGGNENPNEETRIGAGGKLEIPIGGDAKYIGVDSKGLEEQRQSLRTNTIVPRPKPDS